MMIQPSEKLVKLFEEYEKATDIKEREQISEKIHEEWVKINEEYKDCPFVH